MKINNKTVLAILGLISIATIVIALIVFDTRSETENILREYTCPLQEDFVITSPFGYRWGEFHAGIDLSGIELYGSNVYAIAKGVVVRTVVDDDVWGNYVIVRHENNLYSLYAHLSDIIVRERQNINLSEIIGNVGNSGSVVPRPTTESPMRGTHLHFGLFRDGYSQNENAINPVLKMSCFN